MQLPPVRGITYWGWAHNLRAGARRRPGVPGEEPPRGEPGRRGVSRPPGIRDLWQLGAPLRGQAMGLPGGPVHACP